MTDPPIVFTKLPDAWKLPPTPNFVGLYIGGCVSAGSFGTSFAHSHCKRKGLEPWGWICMRYHGSATEDNGEPSNMLRHEWAHILTDDDHTLAWATALRDMGGQVHDFYGYLPYLDDSPKTPAPRPSVGKSLKAIGKIR